MGLGAFNQGLTASIYVSLECLWCGRCSWTSDGCSTHGSLVASLLGTSINRPKSYELWTWTSENPIGSMNGIFFPTHLPSKNRRYRCRSTVNMPFFWIQWKWNMTRIEDVCPIEKWGYSSQLCLFTRAGLLDLQKEHWKSWTLWPKELHFLDLVRQTLAVKTFR